MLGITVKTNAAHAKTLSAILSPTRNFVPIARGTYFMEANTDVQALRDYDFLVSQRLVSAEAVTLHEGEQ